MPHANIWIRKEDWEEWLKVENKSGLISNAINSQVRNKEMDPKEYMKLWNESAKVKGLPPIKERPLAPPMEKPTVFVSAGEKPERPAPHTADMDFCRHFAVRGFCKKGCK